MCTVFCPFVPVTECSWISPTRNFMNVCVFSLVLFQLFTLYFFCFRLKMKTFTLLMLCLVGCVAKKKDGERVGRRLGVFNFKYSECESGNGACGYCSSTCDSDNGCSIVPAGNMFHILVWHMVPFGSFFYTSDKSTPMRFCCRRRLHVPQRLQKRALLWRGCDNWLRWHL